MTPTMPLIFPNTSNENFEIAIFSTYLKDSESMSLRITNPPNPQGMGSKLCPGGK